MEGSGLIDVLLKTGLVGSGTVDVILSGKNYSRAMLCHKMLVEGLERLLLKDFLDTTQQSHILESLPAQAQERIKELSSLPSKERLQVCFDDPDISTHIERCRSFRECFSNAK